MTYIVTNKCVGHLEKLCISECPVDCIATDDKMAYIDIQVCIDCGACEDVCPVDAIYYIADLPPEHESAIELNKNFYI